MAIPLSIITAASRGVEVIEQLLRDFKNQTLPPQYFEHIIVFDGTPPQDILDLIEKRGNPNTVFVNIKKDVGDAKVSPGTRPRNHGTSIAKGDFVAYADDDDRYFDRYAETLAQNLQKDTVTVVQMSCSESRMYRNGDPSRIRLIPEVGLPIFPIICHVGTPCFCVPRQWAIDNPWEHEPEHDYRFIKRICEKYKPTIRLIPGMLIDVDGLVIKDMRDWVSRPPFYRGD